METKNNPREIKACTSMEELAAMTAKVRASKTYQTSWYVYSTKPSSAKSSLQTTMYKVRASFYDRETALEMAANGQRLANIHDPKGGKELTFKIGNLYDNYWIYKEGSDHRHTRAQEWENIKKASRAYIKAHEQDEQQDA